MPFTKKILFDQLQSVCEEDSNEQLLKYICDFFNTSEVSALLEHIKEEKGISSSNEDEY